MDTGMFVGEQVEVERMPPPKSDKKIGYPVDDVIQFAPLDSNDLPEPGWDRNPPLQL